jgi:hypothetical protein
MPLAFAGACCELFENLKCDENYQLKLLVFARTFEKCWSSGKLKNVFLTLHDIPLCLNCFASQKGKL